MGYLINNSTGARYDLQDGLSAPNGAMTLSDLLTKYGASAANPVDYMGQKGYMTPDGNVVGLDANGRPWQATTGVDYAASMKRQAEQLAMDEKRQKIAEGQIDQKIKLAQLIDGLGGDASQVFGIPSGREPTQADAAKAMGVPVAPNMYSGMSRKGREAMQGKEMLQAEKRLAEEEQDARKQGTIAQDAQRFQELNQRTDTGPIVGSAPVAWVRGLLSNDVQEMKSIQDRLTPKMREPGSGATSDFDAKMFQSALFGVDKNKGANDAIANAIILKAKAEKDRVAFNNAYLQANKTLRGADTAWAKYAEDNPIFDPNSKDIPKLNPNRVKWDQYFSGGGSASQSSPATPASGVNTVTLPDGRTKTFPSAAAAEAFRKAAGL